VRVSLEPRAGELGNRAVAFWTQQRIVRVTQVGQLRHQFAAHCPREPYALVRGLRICPRKRQMTENPAAINRSRPELGRGLLPAGGLFGRFINTPSDLQARPRFVLADASTIKKLLTSD
jgi:hypothetical protein